MWGGLKLKKKLKIQNANNGFYDQLKEIYTLSDRSCQYAKKISTSKKTMFLLIISKQHHFPNYVGHQTYDISFFLYTCLLLKLCCVKWLKSHNIDMRFHKPIFYQYLKFS